MTSADRVASQPSAQRSHQWRLLSPTTGIHYFSVDFEQEDPVRDEDFITEVQTRAGLAVRADAERATWATLAILGEQLPDSAAGPAAAALPERLGAQLWGRRERSRATAAQAGRLSRGIAPGEGSWPGDTTTTDTTTTDTTDTTTTDTNGADARAEC